MHVCYRVQQDPVGKDKIPFLSYLYGFLELMIVEEPSLPFCINGLFYLYRYGIGVHSIFVCLLVHSSSLYRGVEQLGSSQGS